MRGRLITFEGPEGSGKTTQAHTLTRRLQERGVEALYTREPGGTKTGEALRRILQFDQAGEPLCRETEVLLFAASRAQLVRQVILPALERGCWVVCDRFADSTTAYQGFGRGLSIEDMLAINRFAIDGAVPDVSFLLDVDVDTGLERLRRRHEQNGLALDRIEREDRAFHDRVRTGYLELARRWPERFIVVDARRSEREVADEVWGTIERLLR